MIDHAARFQRFLDLYEGYPDKKLAEVHPLAVPVLEQLGAQRRSALAELWEAAHGGAHSGRPGFIRIRDCRKFVRDNRKGVRLCVEKIIEASGETLESWMSASVGSGVDCLPQYRDRNGGKFFEIKWRAFLEGRAGRADSRVLDIVECGLATTVLEDVAVEFVCHQQAIELAEKGAPQCG